MNAYVFVTTTTMVNPEQVAQQIRQIPGIKAADLCWGQPDIIALAESADSKALHRRIFHPGLKCFSSPLSSNIRSTRVF